MKLVPKVWAKGSSRTAGPAQRTGTARLLEPGEVKGLFSDLPPSCGCGNRKRRCDDCGEYYCPAFGHLAHVCEGWE